VPATELQYLSTDSPPVTIYRELAAELIRRVDGARAVSAPASQPASLMT
jgi:hypothetical protein